MARLLMASIVCALAAAGCTQTRQDIAEGIAFVRQADALSSRPDQTGDFPSPFRDSSPADAPGLLAPDERSAARDEIGRRGAGTTAQVRATEGRLGAISPY